MTIDEATGAHWRPALRGAYVLLTERGHAAGRPGLERPDLGRLRVPPARSGVGRQRRRTSRRSGPTSGSAASTGSIQAGQYEYTPDHRPFVGPTAVDGPVAERRLERPRRDGLGRRQPAPARRDRGPVDGPGVGAPGRRPGRQSVPARPADGGRPARRPLSRGADRTAPRDAIRRPARGASRAPGTAVPEWCAGCARPSPPPFRDGSAIEARGPRTYVVDVRRNATTREQPGASVTDQGTAFGSLDDGWSAADPGPRSRAE